MNIQVAHDFVGEHPEDGWFAAPDSPFACVVDGCSEPHFSPTVPPFLYPGGFTGGQMISRTIRDVFSVALPEQSLEEIVLSANEKVWDFQERYRGSMVDRKDASTLANASFSCVKFDFLRDQIRIIWGADVFTLWQTKSGEIGIIGGDSAKEDMEREKAYHDLVAKAGENKSDQQRAREEYFLRVFPEFKRKQDNVKCAVLNGQPEVQHLWHIYTIS